MVQALTQEIEDLRAADLPPVRPAAVDAPGPTAVAAPPARPPADPGAGECTAGDERTIAAIGEQFGTAWAAQDGSGSATCGR